MLNIISRLDRNYFKSLLFLSELSLKKQYRGSFLGVLWTLIQPTVQVIVLSIVFSTILRFDMDNYVLLLVSGLLPWIFIVSGVTLGANSLVSHGGLIKGGCMLPKTIFIISDVAVALYTLVVSFSMMYLAVGLITGTFSLTVFLLWPLVVLPIILFTIFAAIAVAYIAPYANDLHHLLTVAFNALFWTIPIVYPASAIPAEYMVYFEYNPFYILIKPMQEFVYYGTFPSVTQMTMAFSIAAIMVVIAVIIQKKLARRVVYYF